MSASLAQNRKSDISSLLSSGLVLPKAFQEETNVKEENYKLKSFLIKEFNNVLENRIDYRFSTIYSAEDHGVVRGQIPDFLKDAYESKVGKKLDDRVNALLKSAAALITFL